MKKILVVFTGGTIGSAASAGTIAVSEQAAYKLLQMFAEHDSNPASVHFDTVQPLTILSENLTPQAWRILIEAIESSLSEHYDGIIVTHGTDTLAYTANALSFYFHGLAKPILLVSSDYPLDHPKANGLANFLCAVEFIRQSVAPGVFVPFRNSGQILQVHRGTHLACSPQLTGDFYSARNQSFRQFEDNSFILAASAAIKNQPIQTERSNMVDVLKLQPQFSDRILMIKPYPGLDYRHFQLEGVVAVLHDLYHSGTACATAQWGDQHSLVAFIERCITQGIPVYLAPLFKTENAYQSTRELTQAGATAIWNLSLEAAYVKLMLAYGNFYDTAQVNDFLVQEIAGEEITLN